MPVTALRTTISDSLANATVTVEELPVPSATSVSFCSSVDTSFLDEVGHILSSFLKLSIIVLALALVLLGGGNLIWERYRYRRYVAGVHRAREAWQLELAPGADALATARLLAFLGAAESPTLAYLTARLGQRLRWTPSTRSHVQWFGAYVLHPWAVLFLVVGAAGLVLLQVAVALLEGPVRRAAQDQAQAGVAGLSTSVARSIDVSLNATSAQWASETNAVLGRLADAVNDDLVRH